MTRVTVIMPCSPSLLSQHERETMNEVRLHHIASNTSSATHTESDSSCGGLGPFKDVIQKQHVCQHFEALLTCKFVVIRYLFWEVLFMPVTCNLVTVDVSPW